MNSFKITSSLVSVVRNLWEMSDLLVPKCKIYYLLLEMNQFRQRVQDFVGAIICLQQSVRQDHNPLKLGIHNKHDI